jgi:hypothetical protein
MWQQLDKKKKNMIFFGAMIIVLYIAYQFSFKHTLQAIVLNRQLQNEGLNNRDLAGSLPQIEYQHTFYLTALKSYQVKKLDRDSRLWQAVSGMTLVNSVAISFNPSPAFSADTTAIKDSIVSQQFSFKGNYFNLVKLLDTLSKANGIGKITDLKLATKKESQGKGDGGLTMQLTLVGVEK